MKDILFLLGGRDLEMQTIAHLLTDLKVSFVDVGLDWSNAKLSAYKEVLCTSQVKRIYGVELKTDIQPPANYQLIDHHNEQSNELSSLEQIADLLDVSLTPEQKLIAANDKGYIPAMRELGADTDKISQIRKMDREAQGITPEEELQAKKDADEKKEVRSVCIVKTSLSHFSPICDILYLENKDKILIYNDQSWTFYGRGVDLLVKNMYSTLPAGQYYYGGGENGYFGLAGGEYSKEKIQQDIDSVIRCVSPYSYHIFFFPFKWNVPNSEKEKEFSKQIDLAQLKPSSNSSWKRNLKPEGNDEKVLYDEKCYYYPFVSDVLYDSGKPETLVHHYERSDVQDNLCFYGIEVKGKESPYKLRIDSINLNFYSMGVGMLTFYLRNDTYRRFVDILKINQFGRRIFPPFYEDKNSRSQIASCIWLENSRGEINERYREDFGTYEPIDAWKPARFIKSLIEDFQQDLEVQPVIDDRMFVSCWYGNNAMVTPFKNDSEKAKHFSESKEWYSYTYVDDGYPTCQNEEMRKQLVKRDTYFRWSNLGTLYGITRYSFMLLTDEDYFAINILANHLRTIYARMVEYVLIQKMSILNFSGAVTHVCNLRGKSEVIAKCIRSLHKEYIRFMNQYYFKEVTAQDQGIELYAMLEKQFEIETCAKDLEEEIGELHEYATLMIDSERNVKAERLNIIAIIALPATIVAGLFGMNKLDKTVLELDFYVEILLIILVTVLCGFVYMVWIHQKK